MEADLGYSEVPFIPLTTLELMGVYVLWKSGRHKKRAGFVAYFIKNQDYSIFAGLEAFFQTAGDFRFKEDSIATIKSVLPPHLSFEDDFYEYLKTLDCSELEVYSISEGSLVFPMTPLIRIEGPLAAVRLIESMLVDIINDGSRIATNAAKCRVAIGRYKCLVEFGLRRDHGSNGGIGASGYSYIGGIDATNNVAAAEVLQIPISSGHSWGHYCFISSFMKLDDITQKSLKHFDGPDVCDDFVSLVQSRITQLQGSGALGLNFIDSQRNESELAGFIADALVDPITFTPKVDTYDVIRSGIPNFCAVSLALHALGYSAAGIRLGSGDLAYFSREVFEGIERKFGVKGFGKMEIILSNDDLNYVSLDELSEKVPAINTFEIATFTSQPDLDVTIVEIVNRTRITLSEDMDLSKILIPYKTRSYRLFEGNEALLDLITMEDEASPKAGIPVLCCHPLTESNRIQVVPQHVEGDRMKCFWPGKSGNRREEPPTHASSRDTCVRQLNQMKTEYLRKVNSTPYKVFVTEKLYTRIHL